MTEVAIKNVGDKPVTLVSLPEVTVEAIRAHERRRIAALLQKIADEMQLGDFWDEGAKWGYGKVVDWIERGAPDGECP